MCSAIPNAHTIILRREHMHMLHIFATCTCYTIPATQHHRKTRAVATHVATHICSTPELRCSCAASFVSGSERADLEDCSEGVVAGQAPCNCAGTCAKGTFIVHIMATPSMQSMGMMAASELVECIAIATSLQLCRHLCRHCKCSGHKLHCALLM